MTTSLRWTSRDLELLPDDGKRYEIIGGELYMSRQPSYEHQVTCALITGALLDWNKRSGLGSVSIAPGLIFAEDDDVVPDVAWTSHGRLRSGLRGGHLHQAPELVVEVVSPGAANERRDREVKLKLYSRRGVDEYWIVDWRARTVDAFRRASDRLELAAHVSDGEVLQSPVLPGFSVLAGELFAELPPP